MSDISILNIFEPKVRNNIIEFCKDLNATHADMYVVMARKAACLVSVLEKIGLLSLHGEVISERVMDCNIDWRKYESVIVIDDVIISGTTLYQTINKIKDANSTIRVELHVLGVNKNWYNDEVLVREDGQSYIHAPIRYFNNSECIRLSGDIVRLIANYPLPYNIDYPIYNTLRLNSQEFDQLMTLPGWKVAEVSSFSNRQNDIITHTFMPDVETKEDFGPVYMTEAIRHSLLKIRTYCRARTDKRREVYIITIVPMLVLPPIEIKTLQSIFIELAGLSAPKLSQILESNTAQLRFVQFVLADLVARRFIQTASKFLNINKSIEREYSSLCYLFPTPVINRITEIADNYEGVLNNAFPCGKIKSRESLNKINELLDVVDVLNRPFLEMYYKKELRSRALVRNLGKKVFGDRSYARAIDRLKRGISFGELLSKLASVPEFQRYMLVSSFLDKSIDAGVVVPITVENDNLVYRAFRHGEDVQFGQQEERLCYDMLSGFSRNIERKNIPKLWMEKMLVLLFQLGEGDVFMPIQTSIESYSHISRTKKSDIASVKYYLQGPLVVRMPRSVPFAKQYLEPKDKVDWMSLEMVRERSSPVEITDSGMFTFNESKYLTISSGDNEIVVDSKKTEFAKKLGLIFGYLLSNEMRKQKPAINSDDLVMLTSSLETKNVIGAMAAEINICYEIFARQTDDGINKILLDVINGKAAVEESFDVIRRSKWYQALNDGVRKFRWYCDKEGYKIIDTVAAQFTDELYKTTWENLWSPNMEQRGNIAEAEAVGMAYTEGLWLLSVHAYYLMLYCLLAEEGHISVRESITKIEEIRGQLNKHAYGRLVEEILPMIAEFLEKCGDLDYRGKMKSVIYERLVLMFNRGPNLLGRASACYMNSRNIPRIRHYNHALFVEVATADSCKLMASLFESIRFKISKSVERNDTGLIMVQSTEGVLPLAEKQFVLLAYNEHGLYWLLQFAIEANSITRGRGGTRAMLFAGLHPDCSIKHIIGSQIDSQSFATLLLGAFEKINGLRFSTATLYVMSEGVNDIRLLHPRFKAHTQVYEEAYSFYLPNKRDYKLYKYQKMDNELKQTVDIAILTIVDEEAAAVRNGFGMSIKKSIAINGRYYDYCEYAVNGRSFKVVHLQCARQGSVSMAVAACEVINLFNPTRMVLLGIAGGIQKAVNIGDVVIADDVFYYDSRKELPSGEIDRRLKSYTMSNRMYNQVVRYRSIWNQQVSEVERVAQPAFALHVAPIGTGEAVIGNSLSKVTEWLRSVHSKTCAVETEAGGFSDAINQMSDNTIDYLIIRGISDKADVNKDDEHRRIASENAVTVLKDFIEKIFRNA